MLGVGGSYKGFWRNGFRHGFGNSVFEGASYEGEAEKSQPSDELIFFQENGSTGDRKVKAR